METLNTLICRHSVRTYTGDAVSASDLEKLLKAANAAPVGMGLYDQVHLTVVNNQDFIANADTATATIMQTEGTHPTYNVPTLIFVSAKKQNPMLEGVMITSAAILRKQFNEIPPHVEYSLTESAKELDQVFQAMRD